MIAKGRDMQDMNHERLMLRSRMSDLAQVSSWIERLASRHGISASTQFAMNLCLEEVLSNIIRHGYSGRNQHSIAIQFASPRDDYFEFVVEDQAPPFNPVDAPELPALGPLDEGRIGGQGIRLLRRFADSLEYQALPGGNRLTIGFSVAKSALAKD
jgi:anti-sigma regulatory factor (Ser/Thr protein kinase)